MSETELKIERIGEKEAKIRVTSEEGTSESTVQVFPKGSLSED